MKFMIWHTVDIGERVITTQTGTTLSMFIDEGLIQQFYLNPESKQNLHTLHMHVSCTCLMCFHEQISSSSKQILQQKQSDISQSNLVCYKPITIPRSTFKL